MWRYISLTLLHIFSCVLGFHSVVSHFPGLASCSLRSDCAVGHKWTHRSLSQSSGGVPEIDFDGHFSRKDIFSIISATSSAVMFVPPVEAFDGGVGGLGKTKPETGIVFSNPDLITVEQTSTGEYSAELLSPDGTPALLSFYAPWPLMRSSGIESRDLANPEASFVQVAPLPQGTGLQADTLTASFFTSSIFSSSGKFGAYSTPLDIKVKKIDKGNAPLSTSVYSATFTTLTPAMRGKESVHTSDFFDAILLKFSLIQRLKLQKVIEKY